MSVPLFLFLFLLYQIISVKITMFVTMNVANNALGHLHANDGVDEEEHCQEEADVGQRFERLHEGPQQDADRVALPQQFNEAGRAEKAKKADVYESNIVECFLSIKIVSLCSA